MTGAFFDIVRLSFPAAACRFTYGTRTAGVTEAYSTIEFYRGNFDRDAPRVQALFKVSNSPKLSPLADCARLFWLVV